MPRRLFAKGARGDIVAEIQAALLAAGHDPKGSDGIFGNDTLAAVKAFQGARSLPATGVVDDDTWVALLARPIPAAELRSLQLTAAFEGHNYTLAEGNFDGAWLTWGIIGFTLKFGHVQRIVLGINDRRPDVVQSAFGAQAAELIRIMQAPGSEQAKWADSVTVAGGHLAEPLLSGFARFGQQDAVRQEQRRVAREDFLEPAKTTARQLRLRSELGLALCFDSQVQNGGIKAAARRQIFQKAGDGSGVAERQFREVIANAVADNANPKFQEDVRSRKLTLATGSGTVHGRNYLLEDWGLSEGEAAELAG